MASRRSKGRQSWEAMRTEKKKEEGETRRPGRSFRLEKRGAAGFWEDRLGGKKVWRSSKPEGIRFPFGSLPDASTVGSGSSSTTVRQKSLVKRYGGLLPKTRLSGRILHWRPPVSNTLWERQRAAMDQAGAFAEPDSDRVKRRQSAVGSRMGSSPYEEKKVAWCCGRASTASCFETRAKAG